MSSPVVGGIIALYLEKYPSANWSQIRSIMQLTARQDTFTGTNLPDNKWGWGKIDAFAMLTTNVVFGCTDTASINYNPLATIDDGSCLYDTTAVILGCTDPLALNYNPLANTDDGSCIYDTVAVVYGCTDSTAINYNPLATIDDGSCIYDTTGVGIAPVISINLFPNPANKTCYLQLSVIYDGQFVLCDITGRIVLQQTLSKSKLIQEIDISALAPGLYVAYIEQHNKKIKTGKLTKL